MKESLSNLALSYPQQAPIVEEANFLASVLGWAPQTILTDRIIMDTKIIRLVVKETYKTDKRSSLNFHLGATCQRARQQVTNKEIRRCAPLMESLST